MGGNEPSRRGSCCMTRLSPRRFVGIAASVSVAVRRPETRGTRGDSPAGGPVQSMSLLRAPMADSQSHCRQGSLSARHRQRTVGPAGSLAERWVWRLRGAPVPRGGARPRGSRRRRRRDEGHAAGTDAANSGELPGGVPAAGGETHGSRARAAAGRRGLSAGRGRAGGREADERFSTPPGVRRAAATQALRARRVRGRTASS